MRWLALLALLALSGCEAAAAIDPYAPRARGREFEAERARDRRLYVDAGNPGPFFALFPSEATDDYVAGAGLPAVSVEPCDALDLVSGKVGSWWCFNGDGGTAGSQSVSVGSGTPTQVTGIQCPSGPNCSQVTRTVYESGDFHQTPMYQSGSGPLSACIFYTRDSIVTGADKYIFGHYNTFGAVNMSWGFYLSGGSGTARFLIADGTTTTESEFAGGPLLGVENMLCGTWSAASGIKTCLNATCGTPVAKAARLDLNWRTYLHGIGFAGGDTGKLRIRGAFVTDTELSAANQLTIRKAVYADSPTGARGEPIVYLRGGHIACDTDLVDHSQFSLINAHTPCVVRSGLRYHRGLQHDIFWGEDFTNAAWEDEGTPTVTADTDFSPEHGVLADTMSDNDGAAFEGRCQTVTTAADAGPGFAVWAKAGTTNKLRLSVTGTGNSAGDTTCNFTTLADAGWKRMDCLAAAAYEEGIASVRGCVLVGSAASDTGSVKFFGADLQYTRDIGQTPGTPKEIGPYASTQGQQVLVGYSLPEIAIGPVNLLPLSIAATIERSGIAPAKNGRQFWSFGKKLNDDLISDNANWVTARSLAASDGTLRCITAIDGMQATQTGMDGTDRVACSYQSAGITAFVAGSGGSQSGAVQDFTDGGYFLWPGRNERNTANWAIDGVLKDLCLDPNPARCR